MSVQMNPAVLNRSCYFARTTSVVGIAATAYFAWQAYTITAVAIGVLSAFSLIVTSVLADEKALTAGCNPVGGDTSGRKITILTATLRKNITETVSKVLMNSVGLISVYIIATPCEFLVRRTINLIVSTPEMEIEEKKD